MPSNTYALPNEQQGSLGMLDNLAAVLDPKTIALLDPLVPKGGCCLELGAGTGSIAGWMADRVGPDGVVVATDINPANIREEVRQRRAVRVLTHDARTEPFPAGPFDVIHSRCFWAHLAERDLRVPALVSSLAPGGWLAIEDWGGPSIARVLFSPHAHTASLFDSYQRALTAMFKEAGNDPSWVTRIHQVLTLAGLIDVRTTVQSRQWRGGSPGCALPISVSRQAEEKLVGHGISAGELEELRRHLRDPAVVVLGNPTYSVIARRRPEA